MSMRKHRHRNARKITKLARALASLDEHARTVRPAPKRAARASFSA
jgi:hypothetical protein